MKISIITINYNDKGLEKTIKSVINQSYTDIEYIIIDGGSTDDSYNIIKQNEKHFTYWISEQDKGPYDAMNKGINVSNGEYLLFINSGDQLYNDKVIENFVKMKPTEGLVYGDCLTVDENETLKKKLMPDEYSLGVALTNTINHQTIFYKKELFNDGRRYNLEYKIIADWIFTNEAIFDKNCSIKHIDLLISIYDLNGLSSNTKERQKERQRYIKGKYDSQFLLLLNDYKKIKLKNNILTQSFLFKYLLMIYRKIDKNRFIVKNDII